MNGTWLRITAWGLALAALWTGCVIALEAWRGIDAFGSDVLGVLVPLRAVRWLLHFVLAALAGGLATWLWTRLRKDRAGPGRPALALLVSTLALALPAALGWFAWRTPASGARPRHVCLISIDTLRADHLGCYGYGRETSPWIDSLAERGVRFANANSQATATLSSHLSLFTSLYPPQFQITRDDGQNWAQHLTKLTLPERVLTLTEVLGAAGYRTAAFTGGALAGPQYGLGQGFEHFQAALEVDEEDAATRVDWLEAWLDDEGTGTPHFLFLHSFDVHDPYVAPPRFDRTFSARAGAEFASANAFAPSVPELRERWPRPTREQLAEIIDLYDNGIRSFDAELARLEDRLRARGVWDDLLLVLLSDHGEEFQDHGDWGHGPTVYRELVHVPLVVRFPGDAHAGTVVELPVGLVDVAPTIADVCGLPVPGDWRGRSLLPLARGEDPRAFGEAPLYFDTPNARMGVRGYALEGWKLVQNAAEQSVALFDLRADPLEAEDRARAEIELTADLAQRLTRFVDELERSSAELRAIEGPTGTASMHEAQLEQLRRLGYLK